MDSAKYFDMLTNGTYITNVNNGVIQTNDYFGTKTIQGMALTLVRCIIRAVTFKQI